jgi:Leucine-rich repeat (LRR) protein
MLAFFARSLNQARLESGFLERLDEFCERQGVRTRHKFDYELVKHNILMKSRREPYGPRWIRHLFGENVFSRIHELQFSATEFELLPPPSVEVEKDFKALELKDLKFLKRLQFSGFRAVRGDNDGYSDIVQDLVRKEIPVRPLEDLSLLSDLETLEHLEVDTWSCLKSLNGIEQLTQLKTIVGGSGMNSLVDVQALKDLRNLKTIKLTVGSDFASSENWAALSNKPNLVELSVRHVNRSSVNDVESDAIEAFTPSLQLEILAFDKVDPGLEDLHCCEVMPKLRSLRIVGSPTLKSLKGIGCCRGLTHLVIHDCPNLRNVKEIERLRNLQVLSISTSRDLSIPELQCCELKALALREMSGFADLKFLRNMQNLRSLDVSKSGLKSLKGLSRLKSLEVLLLSGCKLESIGCEDDFTLPLDRLDFGYCKSLVDLNGIQNCKSIKTVRLNGCTRLERLTGLGQMSSLKYLDLSGCTAIESLDDLDAVPNLRHVIVNRCSSLSNVDALLHVDDLVVFAWGGCPELKIEDVKPLLQKFDPLRTRQSTFGQ